MQEKGLQHEVPWPSNVAKLLSWASSCKHLLNPSCSLAKLSIFWLIKQKKGEEASTGALWVLATFFSNSGANNCWHFFGPKDFNPVACQSQCLRRYCTVAGHTAWLIAERREWGISFWIRFGQKRSSRYQGNFSERVAWRVYHPALLRSLHHHPQAHCRLWPDLALPAYKSTLENRWQL